MSARNPTDATGLHPTARPTEKRGDIEFQEKDTGLRRDVHVLGAIVGELLKEQCGLEIYDVVESARRAAIDRREGDREAGQRLEALVRSLSPDFGTQFRARFFNLFPGRQHGRTGSSNSAAARLSERHFDPPAGQHRGIGFPD